MPARGGSWQPGSAVRGAQWGAELDGGQAEGEEGQQEVVCGPAWNAKLQLEGYGASSNRPLSALRGDGGAELAVKLGGVGGAVLLVRADIHREGLVFPTFPFRQRIETEGLAAMARDMGHQAWGMPNVEAVHH